MLRGLAAPGRWSMQIDRRQPFDRIDVGPLELIEELAGIDREAFDILPLPLGKQRVKRQTAFAGAAGAGNDDQLAAGNVEVDVFQVVRSRRREFAGNRPLGARAAGRSRGDEGRLT